MTKKTKSKENRKIITKDMTMGEIFEKYPDKASELASTALSYGLHCVGCFASSFETLEQGVMGHGMKEEDLNNILKDLNKIISN